MLKKKNTFIKQKDVASTAEHGSLLKLKKPLHHNHANITGDLEPPCPYLALPTRKLWAAGTGTHDEDGYSLITRKTGEE